jgi:hypothetical protein
MLGYRFTNAFGMGAVDCDENGPCAFNRGKGSDASLGESLKPRRTKLQSEATRVK